MYGMRERKREREAYVHVHQQLLLQSVHMMDEPRPPEQRLLGMQGT